MESTAPFLPTDLLTNDHTSLAILDKYHEKKQNEKLRENSKEIEEITLRLSTFEKSVLQIIQNQKKVLTKSEEMDAA